MIFLIPSCGWFFYVSVLGFCRLFLGLSRFCYGFSVVSLHDTSKPWKSKQGDPLSNHE